MSLDDESHGTKVWLSYLGPVLDALSSGTLLIVDEIDTSLHPRLSAELVGLFRSTETNPHGAQMIFTSHDVSLLGRRHDEDILGRDEVWFVEKDRSGATNLYGLADFKPRKDENTERRYLSGSYGAVPTLFEGDFREAVEALRDEGGRAAS
jgi:AAA15 family ATPase/GTPase